MMFSIKTFSLSISGSIKLLHSSSVHVKSSAWLARETIVCVLIMSLIRAYWHHLLFLWLTSYEWESRSLSYLRLASVSFTASQSRVHLLGHQRWEWREASFVRHGYPWLTHSLLRVILIHRIDLKPHSGHLCSNLTPCHSIVVSSCHCCLLV